MLFRRALWLLVAELSYLGAHVSIPLGFAVVAFGRSIGRHAVQSWWGEELRCPLGRRCHMKSASGWQSVACGIRPGLLAQRVGATMS